MDRRTATPFDCIENAQQYIKLLVESVTEARLEIDGQIALASDQMSHTRVQALRMVEYNLDKLQRHLELSSRALNDLRSLRRLLLDERGQAQPAESSQAAGISA